MNTLRERLILLLGMAITALIWLRGTPVWMSAEGVAGTSLLYSAAPGQGIGITIVLGALAVAIAALTAAFTRPLHGLLALAVGLVFPAVEGGTIDEWLRTVQGSSAYWLLFVESLIWAVLVGVAAFGVAAGGRMLRLRLKRPTPDHERTFWGFKPPENAGMLGAGPGGAPVSRQHRELIQLGGSTLLAVIVGAVIASFLVRTSDAWQVVWGLGLAFTVGGLVAHQIFPTTNPLGIIVSPLIAAAGWYGWAALTGGDSAQMLHDYFGGSFTHAALAMPIYYASAGVAGAAAGTLWSHSMLLQAAGEADREVSHQAA